LRTWGDVPTHNLSLPTCPTGSRGHALGEPWRGNLTLSSSACPGGVGQDHGTVAKTRSRTSISGKAAPRSSRGVCSGAVGTGRAARNGISTRSWPNGSNACRGGVRRGWSARVQDPHGLGRRARDRLAKRTRFPFEGGDEGRGGTPQAGVRLVLQHGCRLRRESRLVPRPSAGGAAVPVVVTTGQRLLFGASSGPRGTPCCHLLHLCGLGHMTVDTCGK
jgi:hypothetical protein